jgi:RHS repeat-associated protein
MKCWRSWPRSSSEKRIATQWRPASPTKNGDVTVLNDQGDSADPTDDRTTTFSLTTWGNIVNLPSDVAVHQGSAGGTILKETKFGNFTSGGDPQTIQSWLKNSTENRFITTTAQYDYFGNESAETDALKHTTSYLWDPYGRIQTQITNAAQQVTKYAPNNACSGHASMTDPNQQVTQWGYDGLCRKQSEIRPDQGKTTYAYNSYGIVGSQSNTTTISDPQGHALSTTSYFDGLGREFMNRNNVGDTVSTTYDPRGLVASVTAPNGPATNYVYDARRRLIRTTFPGAAGHNTQTSTYDAWWTTTCDEEGKVRTTQRDAYGQIRLVTESVGSTTACVAGPTRYETKISYDLLGHQTGSKSYGDAAMATLLSSTSTTFDSLGRVLSRIDPDMGTWTYTYDDANRLQTQTDAKHQTITSTYDAINRLTGTTNNIDASGTTFTYDTASHNGVGRLASSTRTSAGGYIVGRSFDYDVMGHVWVDTTTIGTRKYIVQSAYDAMGKLRTRYLPSPSLEKLVYTYDYDVNLTGGRGLPYGLTSSLFTAPIVKAAAYDPRSNPTTRTLGGVVESFTYDPYRFWLTGVSATLGTTKLHNVTLVRDGRGLVTARTNALDPTDDWTYKYDDVRRLTTASDPNHTPYTETFIYDALDRVTHSSRLGTYSYAPTGSRPIHAPTTLVSPANVTTTNGYDANGNLKTSGADSYSYDVENRPTIVRGQQTGYDAAGTRVFQGPLDFIDDGAYEYDTSVNVPTRYYMFAGVRVASATGTALTYYHGDQLNSATTLTNGSGAVIGRQVLSPFGRSLSNTDTTNRIGLAGVKLDTTGLYTMGAREMHPALGIFVTPDPSEAPDATKPQTLNRYAYANNSPTNLVDLTGFAATDTDSSNGDKERHDSSSSDKRQQRMILVGDSAYYDEDNHLHDAGKGFDLAAQTLEDELDASKTRHTGLIEVRSLEQLQHSFVDNGELDGVYFFGHGGSIGVSLGRDRGNNWWNGNLDYIDYSHMTALATFTFYGCDVAKRDGRSAKPFAENLAEYSHRLVYGATSGMNFRSSPAWTPHYAKPGELGPSKKPVYLRTEDGKRLDAYGAWGGS